MKNWGAAIGAVVVLLVSGFYIYQMKNKTSAGPAPTPTLEAAEQLPADKQPVPKLTFTKDAHEVTVAISNLHASQLEYNLIYEATVGKNKDRIETGVYGEEDINGKSTYSQKQLLGSESSGRRTFHENISNARLELTLRDADGRSVFFKSYPFDVAPGDSVEL
jgi:hypothetical protein